MSTYSNFSYLDFDEAKTPFDDTGESYLIDQRKSYEDLSNPMLFVTTNNYFVSDCFDEMLSLQEEQTTLLEGLKFVFGNMFWLENFHPKNEGSTFFFNHWKLAWAKNEALEDWYNLEYYSIHQKNIKKVLDALSKLDLDQYFNLVKEALNLNEEKDYLHRQVIIEWIKMYEVAVEKNKGVVFDIG
ncbi:hypothetical protein BKI52_22065 [marine bacterium AO1-C]|nr:hypothetical protein BKI52_22065 [marine bacterium AO1-C]